MIKTFNCKETHKIFNREGSKQFGNLERVALRKLTMLHAAYELNDLRVPPGNHLEKLHGDRRGQHSIKINDQWRICFEWKNGDAYNLEIVDYH